MRGPEELPAVSGIAEYEPPAFWEGFADYIVDEELTPAEFARQLYRRIDVRFQAIPLRHFDTRGSIGPVPLELHNALGEVLFSEPDEYTDDLVWEQVPTWKAEVDAALGYWEGNRYG